MIVPTLVCDTLASFHDGHPHLQGGQCDDCGEVYFPVASCCMRCLSTRMQPYDLGSSGTLWSWTVQEFLPKRPYNSGETSATFKPYGVGYVEMASGIKVEARLTESDPARLKIGMMMELALAPYGVADDGKDITTFAFRPSAQAPTSQTEGAAS